MIQGVMNFMFEELTILLKKILLIRIEQKNNCLINSLLDFALKTFSSGFIMF